MEVPEAVSSDAAMGSESDSSAGEGEELVVSDLDALETELAALRAELGSSYQVRVCVDLGVHGTGVWCTPLHLWTMCDIFVHSG